MRDHLEDRERMLAELPHNGTTERAALRVLLVESIVTLRAAAAREAESEKRFHLYDGKSYAEAMGDPP